MIGLIRGSLKLYKRGVEEDILVNSGCVVQYSHQKQCFTIRVFIRYKVTDIVSMIHNVVEREGY